MADVPRLRSAALAALLVGCGSGDLPQADNAAILGGSHVASGAYAGGGLLLTNWHVCMLPLFDDSLGDDDYVRLYNDPGDGSPAYREGADLGDYYCLDPDGGGTDLDYLRSSENLGGCSSLFTLPGRTIVFTRVDLGAYPDRLVFASWSIDLCIFSVSDELRADLDERLQPLTLDPAPVAVGQRVVVAGHQRDAVNDVGVDSCEVIAPTRMVVDPDPIVPSPLEVPSFAIDCIQVEHGSSGSPVYDADSGALLGLVWTGTDLGTESAVVQVTAISHWLERFADRPQEQFSRLADLLEAHAPDRDGASAAASNRSVWPVSSSSAAPSPSAGLVSMPDPP